MICWFMSGPFLSVCNHTLYVVAVDPRGASESAPAKCERSLGLQGWHAAYVVTVASVEPRAGPSTPAAFGAVTAPFRHSIGHRG